MRIRHQNAILDNLEFLREALQKMEIFTDRETEIFSPPFDIPPESPALSNFFSAAAIGVTEIGSYSGIPISVLDLMRNPRTRTTKTFPSLIIVARAVRHIQVTGEPITIVTPTSANKGTALRDAVLRAYEAGLVRPDQLTITTLVPASSLPKLWSSPLSDEPSLHRTNPVAALSAEQPPGQVKEIVQELVSTRTREFQAVTGRHLWHTLSLDNYRVADALRAMTEQCLHPSSGKRVHVHSVSSAFGLLGHHFGRKLLEQRDEPNLGEPSAYLLVQHLARPDMVLHLHHGDFAYDHLPAYQVTPDGLYRQEEDPHYPQLTNHPAELLDSTFYTAQPSTSGEMDTIIASQGGAGIVVSRLECLERYREISSLLANAGVLIPNDPEQLREWSLTMAMTGMMTAVDRGILPRCDDILVHGSGYYTSDDYTPIPGRSLLPVEKSDDLWEIVVQAAAFSSETPSSPHEYSSEPSDATTPELGESEL